MRMTRQIGISVSNRLLRQIDRARVREKRSRSNFVQRAVEMYLQRLQGFDDVFPSLPSDKDLKHGR